MIYMFFFPVALEAILYKGPGRSSWQIIQEDLLWLLLQLTVISFQKSDTAAVLEKALTILQDLDLPTSLRPGQWDMNQTSSLFFPCGFENTFNPNGDNSFEQLLLIF